MTASRIGLSIAIVMAIAGITVSSEAKPKTTSKPGITMSAADIIAGRQSGMMMSAALLGAMKSALDRGDDPKSLTFAANGLANWAKATAGQFPSGSQGGEAKPAIWSDATGFKAAAEQYAIDATALLDATKTGDKAKITESWAKVRTNCAACHGKYKAG
jgi:cytochrome c556